MSILEFQVIREVFLKKQTNYFSCQKKTKKTKKPPQRYKIT